VGTEVLLGLPTGVRVQGALFRQDSRSFLIEGVAGVYLTVQRYACRKTQGTKDLRQTATLAELP
jgi:hypothetical protein